MMLINEDDTHAAEEVMTKSQSERGKKNLDISTLSHSSSSSTSSSATSLTSSHHCCIPSARTKKKRTSNKKKKQMNSEELQYVSDMSVSTEVLVNRKTHLELPEPELPLDSSSRRSSSSSVRIEIADVWGDESINFTTSTLRICKEQVLRPYWGLLVFIGWRGLRKESVNAHLRRWRVLNFFYTGTIILLLLYTYMYEMLACEWKLDIAQEKTPTDAPQALTTHYQVLNTTQHNVSSSDDMDGHVEANPNVSSTPVSRSHNGGCDHIISTYLIPNMLHLVAYVMGLYYFRQQENEQLYALMEKVFLQATPIHARTASQQKMIIRLRIILGMGSIWVLYTVLVQCLYVWAFDFPQMPLFTKIGPTGYWIMLVLELVGRTVFNSVILAIVMNYITQCEMLKFYVRGLTTRLQEKSTDLKTAMKDVLTIRHSLGLLNGIISKMTSLVTFIMAELTIIGICIVFMNNNDDAKVWIYRALFPLAWVFMLVLPLWQAARVNSIFLRIQKISLEMRVFGYKGASMLDLDSFLQFITLIKPKAKLFHIPVLPSHLIFAVVIAAFIILTLIQTGSIGMSLNGDFL